MGNRFSMKTMFNIKYCTVCGSDFIVHDPDDWTYKMRDARHIMRYYCSYKCFRRAGDEKNKLSKLRSADQ